MGVSYLRLRTTLDEWQQMNSCERLYGTLTEVSGSTGADTDTHSKRLEAIPSDQGGCPSTCSPFYTQGPGVWLARLCRSESIPTRRNKIAQSETVTTSRHIGDPVYHYRSKGPGGHFKNTYELLNPRALKISMLYKNRIFQCMGKIFCVEFQREPLKFHTKYLTHTLKDVDFIHGWNESVFETPPRGLTWEGQSNVLPLVNSKAGCGRNNSIRVS